MQHVFEDCQTQHQLKYPAKNNKDEDTSLNN